MTKIDSKKKVCCIYHDFIDPWVDGGECGMAGMADKPSVCCRKCPSKYHSDNHYFVEEATEEEKAESDLMLKNQPN